MGWKFWYDFKEEAQMSVNSLIANTARRVELMFPGYFQTTTKRNYYGDFGYPETLTFNHYHQMYRRNGIARAAVDKTVLKTWQTNPLLQEDDDADVFTEIEQAVFDRFNKIKFWQNLAEADRRSLVGGYSALIFRFADNKAMKEPVDTVSGGLEGLVEVIPSWERQLEAVNFDTDERSENYGQPTMFKFIEGAVFNGTQNARSFEVHPDRVFIWSREGGIYGESLLSAGYNNLIDIEKINGAGGEGFWKNAKSAPILQIDKDADIQKMAQGMGVPVDELADKMDEQVTDYQKGFDALLMLQGMEAKTLGVTLPQPAEFISGAMQSFAASIVMPIKILVGMQTGERASKEDAKEWAQTNMSRRSNSIIPNITAIIEKLVSLNILVNKNWSIHWDDLTESSMPDKIERADKMASINQKEAQSGSDEIIFTADEIRETVGLKPLTDAEAMRENPDKGDRDE